MKKLKLNLDYLHNTNVACNETPSATDGIVFVPNEPLPFNGHSLDVDVCMKTGVNLGQVNMNVITPSPSDASSIAESLVKNIDLDSIKKDPQSQFLTHRYTDTNNSHIS